MRFEQRMVSYFLVQGRVQQLKLVEAKNHKSKLKLIDSNQTILTLDSDNNDTLNTKLDNLFQHLNNKMHPLSKQGLVGKFIDSYNYNHWFNFIALW